MDLGIAVGAREAPIRDADQLATAVEPPRLVIEDNEATAMNFTDCFVTLRDCLVRRNNDVLYASRQLHGLVSQGAGVIVATSSEFQGGVDTWGVSSLSGVLIGHGLSITGHANGGVRVGSWPGSTPHGSWLRSCRITGNRLGVTASTTLVLADCEVSNNAPTDANFNQGSGVSIDSRQGRSLVLRSSITNNGPAFQGGGLFLLREVDVVDSLISGNTAMRGGGGLRAVIYVPSQRTRLFGCTIVGNHDDERGGGISVNTAMPVPMSNTILQGNTAGMLGDDCEGTLELIGPSLIGFVEPGTCFPTGDVGELLEGLDPMLLPVGNFGGPTPSQPPAPGSPAIDAGSPLPVGGGPPACSERDQRGVLRPQGARCDLGAVEVCDDLSGIDTDGDGVLDDCDLCPLVADEQRDQDRDGFGDACDTECGDEPSALDLDPTATPLRVSKFSEVPEWIEFADASGWIELTWEADGVESDHELVRGSLAGLHAGYDHRGFGACRLPSGWLAMPTPTEDSYFLIVARCGEARASPGRDSFGVDRPQPTQACR